MLCPRCGWQQADTPECIQCGVVVARHHARPRPEPAARPGPRDLIVLAADAAIALIVYRWPDLTGRAPNAAPDRAGAAMEFIYAEKSQLKIPDEFIQDIEDRMERQARELRKRGVAAQQGCRLDESVDLLSLALRMKPDDPEAYLQRGRARLEAGAMDDAFDDVARAARLKPGDPAAYEAADRYFMREKRWDETVACWTSFLDRNPSEAKAYLARARALLSKGAHAASRADVEQACELGDATACRWTGARG